MRKIFMLSTFVVLILTSILAGNAFAADSYSYTDNLGGTSATLLTENGTSTKTWTMYPNIELNAEGRFVLSGSPVSVNFSNKDAYKGYFYEQGGKVYRFENAKEIPDGIAIDGGYVKIGTEERLCFRIRTDSSQYKERAYTWDALKIDGETWDNNWGWRKKVVGTGNSSEQQSWNGHDYDWKLPYFIFLHTDNNGGNDNYISGDACVITRTDVEYLPPDVPFNNINIYGYPVTLSTSFNYVWDFLQVPVNTVAFDYQGGSGSLTSKQVVWNTMYGALPTPAARTGYTFSGWFTAPEGGGTKINSTDTVGGNITLYSKWSINQYTVSFESNGGSSVAAIKQNYGTTVAEPAKPTRTGHIFAGWYTDAALTTAWNFSADTVIANMTLYAKWTTVTNKCTVSFNSSGGSSVDSQAISNGDKVTKPSDPTRTGYTFAGWYTDAALTTAWNFSADTVIANMTLYAKWTTVTNKCTVSFNSSGGSSVDSQAISNGDKVTKPSDPTRTGYTFAGWYSDEALTTAWDFAIGTVSCDITLYAKWTGANTVSGLWTYRPNSDGKTATIIACSQTSGNISIPSTIDGFTVTSIEGDANNNLFCSSSNSTITSVELPMSLTKMGANTFKGCTGVTAITLPGNVTSIETNAFCGDTSMTSVYFQGPAPDISKTAFSGISLSNLTFYYKNGKTGWTKPTWTNNGITYNTSVLPEALSSTITVSTVANKTYDFTFFLSNIDCFSGKSFTLTYDSSVLQPVDLCSFTYAKELTAGDIAGTGVTIVTVSPGQITFTVNKTISSGKKWTGITNVFEFRAITTQSTSVSVA